MARVKFSGLITSIAGSVGGWTFQRNLYGHTLRTKPIPIRPNSAAQSSIKSLMIQVEGAWTALTPAVRLQWDNFILYSGATIKKNKGMLMSGHALFIKYQMYRLVSGLTLLTTINYNALTDRINLDSVKLDAGALILYFSDNLVPDTFWALMKVSYARIPSRKFYHQGLRVVTPTVAEAAAHDITSDYVTAFGILPSLDDTLHCSIILFSTTSPVYWAPQNYVLKVEEI